MIINSLQNAKVKFWLSLQHKKYRQKHRCFLVAGEHLVQEAKAKGRVLELMSTKANQEAIQISEKIARKLSQTETVADIFAVVKMADDILPPIRKALLLDQIQDAGNVGTLIRSAAAFGFDAVIAGHNTVDIYNDKTIRASQGAIFYINVIRADLAEIIVKLKQDNFTIIATGLHENTQPLSKITPCAPLAVILGNEGQGVRYELMKQSDMVCKIEMAQFESLNVAIAGSIICYYFQKA